MIKKWSAVWSAVLEASWRCFEVRKRILGMDGTFPDNYLLDRLQKLAEIGRFEDWLRIYSRYGRLADEAARYGQIIEIHEKS